MAAQASSRVKQVLKLLAGLILALLLGLILYGAQGYFDALRDAEPLAARADRLIANGEGAAGLGPGRVAQLLRVEDPNFLRHGGVDFSTPGAGMTSITQSLAKRVAFTNFRPGLRKIRQTAYAVGLERRLSKPQILALFLDTAQLGRGKESDRMIGFYDASEEIYGVPPARLSNRQFLSLVAVLIAPRNYDLRRPDPRLDQRVARIARLLSGEGRPQGKGDVWLDGCA